MDYFDYCSGQTMINKNFESLFNFSKRTNESEITQFYMDIAASIQRVTEEIVILITKNLTKKYKIKNLCLAGGVALNCVANGKIHKEGDFDEIWIQPAAGDSGGALGAALSVYYDYLDQKRFVDRKCDSMRGSYLGPSYSNEIIAKDLDKIGGVYTKMEEDELIALTAKEIENGAVIGWFQDKMEFGPRALGSRSILADPEMRQLKEI